jgi:hypothetical protein
MSGLTWIGVVLKSEVVCDGLGSGFVCCIARTFFNLRLHRKIESRRDVNIKGNLRGSFR